LEESKTELQLLQALVLGSVLHRRSDLPKRGRKLFALTLIQMQRQQQLAK
jgi:hypothetical protein